MREFANDDGSKTRYLDETTFVRIDSTGAPVEVGWYSFDDAHDERHLAEKALADLGRWRIDESSIRDQHGRHVANVVRA